VGEVKADEESLSVEIEADEGDPCETAKNGLWSVLQRLMLERRIIYRSNEGRTNELNTAQAITLDQI
jgi:hypothetical protein